MRKALLTLYILVFIGTGVSMASHFQGADLYYTCIDPTTNTYELKFSFFRDCDGTTEPSTITIDINSVSCGQTLSATLTQDPCPPTPPGGSPCEVSPLCDSLISQSTCNGGTLPGVQQYTYTGTVTLPMNCPDWILSYDLCCRNGAITNLTTQNSLYIESLLNNTIGCNNSPRFTTLPVPYICINQPFSYNHGAVDVDGDSLYYSLIDPLDIGAAPYTHTPGLSATYPLSTASGTFGFDPNTGQMSFTPNAVQVAVVTVLVQEFRGGVLIGSSMRDMQIQVLALAGCSNPAPVFYGIDSSTVEFGIYKDSVRVEVCPGDTLRFNFSMQELSGDSLLVGTNLAVSIPNANIEFFGRDSVYAVFEWLPLAVDTGLKVFIVNLENNSCPIASSQSYAVSINVLPGTYAGPDRYYCPAGGPVALNVIGGTMFNWTPSTGLSDPTSPNPTASPATTTTYYVESNLSSTCKNRDTVTVFRVPDFTFTSDVAPDTICRFQTATLSVNADPTVGPYTYLWQPFTEVTDSSAGTTTTSPDVDTEYTVRITSDDGCVLRDTLNLYVTGEAPLIDITGYDTVCQGDSVQLNVITCAGSTLFDVFDPGIDMSQWSNNTGAATADCGFVSAPNALYFNSATPRVAETNDLNVINGGEIEFWLKIANGSSAPCETADAGEDVVLEYSVSGTGGPWIPINTYLTGPTYANFTFINVPIPPAAQTTATRFRWIQPAFSGTGTDNWALDDVRIECCGTTCGSFNYTWTPSTGVSDPSSVSPYLFPTTTTQYVVEVVPAGTDCASYDTVTVHVVPDFDLTMLAPNPDTICANGTSQLAVSPEAGFGPYTYLWTPFSLSDSSDRTPVATPEITTTYTVEVTSAAACKNYANATVYVDGIAPLVNITSDINNICPGDTVSLFGTASALPCGSCLTPCTGTFGIYELGAAASTSVTETPYKAGFQDARIQMLFRASELIAAGMAPGQITDALFNVDSKNSTIPFNGFTIKMGCTEENELTGFVDGLETVFNPKPVVSVNGWNTHNLDTPYCWDGSSNLIVEVCFDNASTSGTDLVFVDATPFNSVVRDDAFGSNGCTLDIPFLSSNRPQMRFLECTEPPVGLTYQWEPATGVFDDTALTTQAVVNENTTFILYADDGNCEGSGFIDIMVDSSYFLDAGPTIIACNGQAANLNANILGTPPVAELLCGVNRDSCIEASATEELIAGTGSTFISPFLADTGTYTGVVISDQRTQIIYRAGDLNAAGFEAGIISALEFNLATKVSRRPYLGLNIRIGCTSETFLDGSAWLPTELVYSIDTFNTALGWNRFVFDSLYSWDGSSNLVVELCWNNTSANSPRGVDDIAGNATAGYDAMHLSISSLGTGCNLNPNPANVFNVLPDIRLDMCPPPPADITYIWSPTFGLSDPLVANPVASPPNTTTYTVNAIFANGCVRTDTVTVVIDELNTSITPDTSICLGDVMQLIADGEAGATYSWDTSSGGLSCYDCANPIVTTDSTTTFTVTITGANGCVVTETVTVDVSELVANAIYSDTLIDQGESIVLGANVTGGGGMGTYVYSWDPSTYLSDATIANPTATPLEGITYTLTVISGDCSDTTQIRVDVNIIESPVAIPTVFSPNGDGLNDFIEILTLGNATVKKFQIYNRWGEVIFSEPSGAWDGTYLGEDQPVGTYVYNVVIERPFQDDEYLQGTITLIR